MSQRPQTAALNHVSIPARDLEESEAFYREVLGCERIQAPNFGFPVCWMRLGNLQLHLQQVGPLAGVRTYQHFAVEVTDFVGAYGVLRARGAFEEGTRYADLWMLPSGELQMFVRDPSDNLFEIDHPDVTQLDLSVFDIPLRRLENEQEQTSQNRLATLFLYRKAVAGPQARPTLVLDR
ncbi:VOC family protein [Mesorhizobium qingshengii]|uniref:VOC family protein n=1 Tax=Mesorhizobium qingshengii TaxID=1165689 RepID=A0ABT4QZH4_9HYPH|nr:VOC family protein [Mesorhizobium qingshengii]MCZ8546789.1 VOC family protein [Mesorhizobium qingshengii]